MLKVQDGPVKHIVVLKTLSIEEFLEESFQIRIVRAILETEGTTVFKIGSEFGSVALAELFRAGGHFSIHDSLVLLLFGVGFESLPGERSANKVHQDVSE